MARGEVRDPRGRDTKKYDDETINQKKFEDLSEEEMAKVQGSGDDIDPESTAVSITGLFFSKNGYDCRK